MARSASASCSSRSDLRKVILGLPIGGERKLRGSVKHGLNTITEVVRHGKRGVAYASDGFQLYSLNDLSEGQCAMILCYL